MPTLIAVKAGLKTGMGFYSVGVFMVSSWSNMAIKHGKQSATKASLFEFLEAG